MFTLWVGFLLGCIFFPIMYAIIPSMFGPKRVKNSHPRPVKTPLPISETLKTEISKSMISTDNLAWINVILQRMYFDMIKNYCFEYKIRQNIMRSFGSLVGDVVVKNIRITDVVFGCEAPYLKNIRLITPEEYNMVISGEDLNLDLQSSTNGNTPESCTVKQKIANYICRNGSFAARDSSTINFSSLNGTQTTNASEIPDATLNDGLAIPAENNVSQHPEAREDILKVNPTLYIDDTKAKEMYSNATFMGNMEYNGTIQMMFEVEVQMGLYMNSVVTIKKLASDFLFRIPALGYNTRYEICLINTPNLDIDVSSGLITGDRLYFQAVISSFLTNVITNSFKRMFFYPAWFQGILPFVASGKLPEFIPRPVIAENLEAAMPDFEKILLAINSDQKVVETKDGITRRKTYSLLNGVACVNSWSFKVPKSASVNRGGRHTIYEGLNLYESKILSSFEKLEMLRLVVPSIMDVAVIAKNRRVALLKITMDGYVMELVRLIHKNNLLFFRNNSKYSEFLVLKIQDGEFISYSFSTHSSDIFLNTKRVINLRALIENKPSPTAEELEDNSDTESIMEIETLFKNAISIDTIAFKKFEMTLPIPNKAFRDFLMDDALRIKNIHQSAKLVSIHNQNEKIKAIIIEYPSENNCSGREFTKIYSLFEKRYLIDLCPDHNIVLLYRLKGKNVNGSDGENESSEISNESLFDSVPGVESVGDKIGTTKLQNSKEQPETTTLAIVYKSDAYVQFPNFFIEMLKTKACFNKYFEVASQTKYEQYRQELKIESYVKKGTIFFQFTTEIEDDFSLLIFSCKKQRVIFEIYKIISSKMFVLIYPVDNDYIRLTLVPKYGKNIFIDYKFINFEKTSDVYLESRVGLNCKNKIKIKMQGAPTHMIFWEKSFDVPLKSYIQDSEDKTELGECGVLRTEAREYILIFKNEGKKRRDIDILAGLAGFH